MQRLRDISGQVKTLNQLGLLYEKDLGHPEEAVTFFRQAVDMCVRIHDTATEGKTRNNLGKTLLKCSRLDEARQEIHRAIDCKAQFGHEAEPWTAWHILADIETDAGNLAAASEARRKAIDCYLAYRRDGGENHHPSGRFTIAVTEILRTTGPDAASSLIQQGAARSDADALRPFLQALQAILGGSRDRALADDLNLDYTMAAELLLFIETIEKFDKPF